ncbi:hypothetical protein ABIB25_000779 [Nakamurella sp. UYEF19]|uniref:SHOCT domain-containing protein n=1 Tax=Nakamurella sp. UYEF19 TaxID=1756392 RepID=UPI003393BAE1
MNRRPAMSMQLTPTGDAAISEIVQRYRLSEGAVRSMLDAIVRGGGSMAQFSIAELGGNGQWMRGGMTMVGDMFNTGLQSTVSNLCLELSTVLAAPDAMVRPEVASSTGTMMPLGGLWWPAELGAPSSSGGQNDAAYAYFPKDRRLAVRAAGRVVLYDTGDHLISGVQQQQGGVGTQQFTSQYGTFAVDILRPVDPAAPVVTPGMDGPRPTPVAPTAVQTPQPVPTQAPTGATHPAPTPTAPQGPTMSAGELVGAIETLAGLRDKGILTEDEFTTKKTELLARL